MQLPRMTTRRWMIVTAVPSVSWGMFLGFANLIAYFGYAEGERYFREGAAIWEAKGEAGRAATWRGYADEQARMRRDFLSRGSTTLGLLGLGGILGGIALAVRARYGAANSDRPSRLNTLAASCSVGAKLIFVSLAIAGLTYIGFLLLVMAGYD